jgi:predicted HAD superfamily hydrolase
LSEEVLDRISSIEVISINLKDALFGSYIEPINTISPFTFKRIGQHFEEDLGPKLSEGQRRELEKTLAYRSADPLTQVVARAVSSFSPDLREHVAEMIVRYELEAVSDCLYEIAGIQEFMNELKKRDKRCVLLSDMHLSKSQLLYVLNRKAITCFDSIYSRADLGADKSSEALFRSLLHGESISPQSVLHIGTDQVNDFRVPSRLGLNTVLISDPLLKAKKKVRAAYRDMSATNPYWRGMHVMASTAPPQSGNFYYDYGFSFFGPVFCTYILGALEIVRKYKIEDIYFLAREGKFFQQLFELLAPDFLKDIPRSHYVYLSRRSVALASIYEGLTFDKAVILPFDNPKQQGLYSILQAFGLPWEEFTEKAAYYGLPDIRKPLWGHEDMEILRAFCSDAEFTRRVIELSAPYRVLVEKYLSQEGFFGKEQVAFVDVGWLATIQKLAGDAFGKSNDYPHVYGLYMGFREAASHRFDSDKNTLFGLLCDNRVPEPQFDGPFHFLQVFEQAARAFHPTATGFVENTQTGEIEPTFKSESAPDRLIELRQDPVIRELQQGVIDFAEQFRSIIKSTAYTFSDVKPFVGTLMERHLVFPTAEEADRIMNLKHSEDFGTDNVMDWAGNRTRGLRSILKPRTLWRDIRGSYWPAGTAGMSGGPVLQYLLRIRDLLRS